MIKKPNYRVTEALATIKSHPDFRVVTEWLQESLDDTRNRLEEELDTTVVRHEQGGAQTLRQILTHIEKSREYVERAQAQANAKR